MQGLIFISVATLLGVKAEEDTLGKYQQVASQIKKCGGCSKFDVLCSLKLPEGTPRAVVIKADHCVQSNAGNTTNPIFQGCMGNEILEAGNEASGFRATTYYKDPFSGPPYVSQEHLWKVLPACDGQALIYSMNTSESVCQGSSGFVGALGHGGSGEIDDNEAPKVTCESDNLADAREEQGWSIIFGKKLSQDYTVYKLKRGQKVLVYAHQFEALDGIDASPFSAKVVMLKDDFRFTLENTQKSQDIVDRMNKNLADRKLWRFGDSTYGNMLPDCS